MSSSLTFSAVLQLVDRMSPALRRVTQHSQQLTERLARTRTTAQGLEQQLGQIQSLNRLQAELSQTSQRLDQARTQHERLAQAMQHVQQPTVAMVNQLNRAERQVQSLTDRQTRQTTQLQHLQRDLQAAGIDTSRLGEAEQRLSQRLTESNRLLDAQRQRLARLEQQQQRNAAAHQQYQRTMQTRSTLQGAGVEAGLAAGATGATLLQTIKAYATYEDAMLGLARQVPGMRDQNFKLTASYHQLGNDLQRLSERLPMATTGLIALAEGGSRMGVVSSQADFETNRRNLLRFTETIAGAAVAFDMQDQAQQLGEDMGRIASLFKHPIAQINQMGDILNYLDDNAQSKGGDIINVMQRMAGVATQVGMSWRDTAALGSTFLSLGASPEIASTAGNAMIRELAIANMQPKRFQAGLDALGLKAASIQKGMATNATGTILKVLDAINKLPKARQAEITTQLFGKEYGDDAAKLANNIQEYRRQLQLVQDTAANGSMDREMQARTETLSAQWQILKNRLFNNNSSLGALLRSNVAAILSSINSLLGRINQWISDNPELAGSILKVVAAIAIVLGAISGLAFTIATVLGPFALLRLSMMLLAPAIGGAATAVWAFMAPLLPIIAAIGLLAAAAYLLYTRWDQLAPVFKAVRSAILDGLTFPLRTAIDMINRLISAMNLIPGVKIPAIPQIPTFYTSGDLTASMTGIPNPARTGTQGVPPLLARPPQAASVPPLATRPNQTLNQQFGGNTINLYGGGDGSLQSMLQQELDKRDRDNAARQRSILADR